MLIKIPDNLFDYIRLKDGEIAFKKELPRDLDLELQKFKTKYMKSLEEKGETENNTSLK